MYHRVQTPEHLLTHLKRSERYAAIFQSGRFENLKPADYRYSFLKVGLGTRKHRLEPCDTYLRLILIHPVQIFRLMKVEDTGR
jgi:hypothetical protein